MFDWRNRRQLEDYLAFLGRRVNELEARVAELEAEASAEGAANPDQGQSPAPRAQPPIPQGPGWQGQAPWPGNPRPDAGAGQTPWQGTAWSPWPPRPNAGWQSEYAQQQAWAMQQQAQQAAMEAQRQAAADRAAADRVAAERQAADRAAAERAATERQAAELSAAAEPALSERADRANQPTQGQPSAQEPRPAWANEPRRATGGLYGSAAGAGSAAPLRPGTGAGSGKPPIDVVSLTSLRDLESRLTGRILAWVGGAAVLLGVVFFLSLAFSRGWIGPEGRVVLGLLGGGASMAAGAWLFDRKQAPLGHVLVAVGLGVVSLSLFAGTRLYDLYAPEWALAGSFVAAVCAAAIAIRARSEVLAIFGLLAVAAAPPVMGASANLITVAFLAVTVVGTTLIALWRSWRWLPPAAFVITAPQFAYWLANKPDPAMAIPAIALFWALNAIAASADDLRAGESGTASEPTTGSQPARAPEAAARPDAPPIASPEELASARAESLLLANSLVAILGGLWVLTDAYLHWQGAFLAGAALAHFALGAFFVRRRGSVYPFGLLANAIGVVVVALAIERQWDGILVPIGWAVEAVALAFFYGRRKNDYAGVAAAIIGGLQILHLLIYEYPWLSFSVQGQPSTGLLPFANQPGVALAGVLMAAVASGWATQNGKAQMAITAAGALFFAYTLPFQLTGPALVAAWAIEGAGLLGFWRTRRFDYLAALGIPIAGLSVVHLLAFEFPILNWQLEGTWGPGQVPFADQSSLALGCVLAAAVVGGWLSRNFIVRLGLLMAGSLLLAYALPFELKGAALVAAWSAVAALVVAAWRFRPVDEIVVVAAIVGGLAVAHLLCFEYPVDHWTLHGVLGPGGFPFADESALALGSILLAGAIGGWLSRSKSVRYALLLGGSVLVAYVLPFELQGPALIAGWCAELVVIAAIWGWGHDDVAVIATTLPAFLPLANFGVYQMPLDKWTLAGGIAPGATPFLDAASASLAILLVAAALVGALSRSHAVRCALATGGLLLAMYSLPYELRGVALVAAWAVLIPISVAADRLLDLLPGVPSSRARLARVPVWDMKEVHWPDVPLAAEATAAFLALAHLYALDLPSSTIGHVVVPANPFADSATMAALIVAGCLVLSATLTLRADLRVAALIGAVVVAASISYFELALPYAVVVWAELATVLLVGQLWDAYGRPAHIAAAAALVIVGSSAFLTSIDPPDRLGVMASVSRTGVWFAIDSIVSAVALVIAAQVSIRCVRMPRELRAALTLASGVLLVYLASTLVVDFFQGQVGGRVALEELQKQAQVGVSILWAIIGMAVFVIGVSRAWTGVREAGLALLGLATAKVFVFDLSYLDVAYRVLSLIGLGLLLLLAAFVYQSFGARRESETSPKDEPAAE